MSTTQAAAQEGAYDLDADRARNIKTADQLQRLPAIAEVAAMTTDEALMHLTWPEFENDEPRFLYAAARVLGAEVLALRAQLAEAQGMALNNGQQALLLEEKLAASEARARRLGGFLIKPSRSRARGSDG